MAEEVVPLGFPGTSGGPVDPVRSDGGYQPGDDRGGESGDDDLVENSAPLDTGETQSSDRGADETAEQGVRGA